MNRSVINWMITAGVLTVGAGVGAAPAVADPVGSGAVSGAGTDDRSTVTGHRPVRTKGTKGRAGAGKPDGCADRPCQWPWMCNPREVTRGRRNSAIVLPPVIPSALQPPSAPVVEPAAEPDLDIADIGRADAASPESAAAVDEATPVQAAPPVRARSAFPAPTALARPARVPAGGAPAPAAPLFQPAPAPPAAPPPLGPEPVQAARLGYPDDLRNADFRKVASVALPGLAALAGMTALGGVFGYRQAKAGYVLRTVAAGRFLQ